jgi:DNA gyrase subunit A
LNTSTHDTILFFTSRGRVFRTKGYQVPEFSRTAKGLPIINLLGVDKDEKVTAMIPVDVFEADKYLFFSTRHGIVKRTPVSEFANIRSNGLIALTLRGDDELIGVKMTKGDENISIGTKDGMLIKFNETDIRSMGRIAGGVRGIRLREGDIVIGMDTVNEGDEILVVTEKGFGKRTPEDEYRIQTRGGYGLKTLNVTERNGLLVAMKTVDGTEDLMLITIHGILIRMDIDDISVIGRSTQGVRLIRLGEDELVATVAKVVKEEEEEPDNENVDESEVPSENNEDITSSAIEVDSEDTES